MSRGIGGSESETGCCVAALRRVAAGEDIPPEWMVIMSGPELVESVHRLEIRSPMRPGMRVLIAAVGFVPLLAPYELLIRVNWEHYLNPFFVFAALIAAGATAVSGLFFFAAMAGVSSNMVFDRRAGTFSYSAQAPLVRRNRHVYPLADVRAAEVGMTDWSDGAPTYHLRVTLNDGCVFDSGSSWAREPVEAMQARVHPYLARYRRAGGC
jgi:hypothetical protein